MKKIIGILLLVILANLATAQEKFIIVDTKHPPATIIIPNNSGKELKNLADELKNI